MFAEEIRITNKAHLRYGWTKLSFSKTQGHIMKLLDKHGCDKILVTKDGDEWQLGFVYQNVPYLFVIPKVFLNGVYDDKIGIRLIFRYLETSLELAKVRACNLSEMLLAQRLVEIDGEKITLGNAVKCLPPARLFETNKFIEAEWIDD
mgnify:CR=1 FL=1